MASGGRPPPLDDDPERLRTALKRAGRSGEVVDGRGGLARGDDDELDEGPSRDDVERFGGVTRKCPECGKDVFDDTAVCYHCGHAFMGGPARMSKWVLAAVALVVLAMIGGVLYQVL